MITECIILAGGLGTRLRSAVPDLPKAMAPVAGKPFLSYVIDGLRMQGIRRFVFSLGYMHEVIEQFLREQYPTLDYTTIIEPEPFGTGGAIQLALQAAHTDHVLITNGDTLFRADVISLEELHRRVDSECTLALKPMQDFDRYGCVEIDEQNQVVSFREKQHYTEGLINGGLYLLNRQAFLKRTFPVKFSFEKDYLEAFIANGSFYAVPSDAYFIDIGIPHDFEQAQKDLSRPALDLSNIDPNWTLFLDRDGVINQERANDYVQHWEQFIFNSGVLHTFKTLSDHFGRVFVVSNQRGVGRGIMTEAALQSIHLEMQREVAIVGGRIDKIYYCTDVDAKSFHRKPNPGMALQAKKDFDAIDFSKSIMVGNKPSDMRFGRAAGMFTVFVTTTNPDQAYPHPDIDLLLPSVEDFARLLSESTKEI
jgi:D-glycero-alpha-D-manno-heptose 1-phosphate guanylyltransferase